MQLGTGRIGLFDLCTRYVGFGRRKQKKIGKAQIGAGELDARRVSAAERRLAERGLGEVAPVEHRLTEHRIDEPRTAEAAVCESGRREIDVTQIQTGKVAVLGRAAVCTHPQALLRKEGVLLRDKALDMRDKQQSYILFFHMSLLDVRLKLWTTYEACACSQRRMPLGLSA